MRTVDFDRYRIKTDKHAPRQSNILFISIEVLKNNVKVQSNCK